MHTFHYNLLLPCIPYICACALLVGMKMFQGDVYALPFSCQTIKTRTPRCWNFPRSPMLGERKACCSGTSQRRSDPQEDISEFWQLVPSCPLFKPKSYVRMDRAWCHLTFLFLISMWLHWMTLLSFLSYHYLPVSLTQWGWVAKLGWLGYLCLHSDPNGSRTMHLVKIAFLLLICHM